MIHDAEDLSEALDLEFYVDRESLGYKRSRGRSGEQFNMAECPCCGDDRYRVYLNAETGVGNCFKCESRFTKLSFIFANLHGRTPDPRGADGENPDKKAWRETMLFTRELLKEQGWRPKRMVAVAVDDGPVELPKSFPLPTPEGQNLIYLEKRGITAELARYFSLRFCEKGWWNFDKDDGTRGGQQFDNRVIIPVYDLDGELATFQGRDVLGTAEDKYRFPKMLPGTGRYLYNGQNAMRCRRIAVGEGAFDVMALKIACDEVSDTRDIVPVGTFGKHLSSGDHAGNDQLGRFLQLQKHGLKEVIICWDGEVSALLAALDAAKMLTRLGLRARIALLPAGKDPNEVPGSVTRAALMNATLWTPAIDIKWRLVNPYKVPAREKSLLRT